VDHNVVLLNAE